MRVQFLTIKMSHVSCHCISYISNKRIRIRIVTVVSELSRHSLSRARFIHKHGNNNLVNGVIKNLVTLDH